MMKGISRSPLKRSDGFYRYLKPGALAQLRNSRISARSSRPDSVLTRSLVPRPGSPLPQAPPQPENQQISSIDRIPSFLGEVCGPRCIRRKKLMAAKSAR